MQKTSITIRKAMFPALTGLALSFFFSPPLVAQTAADYSSVAPIFNKHCILCHNGPAAPLGLSLDSYQAIKKGSQKGAVAKPGDAAGSELVKRVRGESLPRMPLTGPPFLDTAEIKIIEDWINAGMPEGQAVEPVKVSKKTYQPGDPVIYTDVAPIFAQRCIKCHRVNAENGPPEGLSLQDYARVTRGGDRAVVVPGSPGASELVRRIMGIAHPRMPFDGPPWLSDEETTLITEWIRQGAKDADGNAAPLPVGRRVRLHGRITGRWSLDGEPLVVDGGTRMKKNPRVGDYVRVRGLVGQDGRIHATRIRRR